jgi:hypothetical protein
VILREHITRRGALICDAACALCSPRAVRRRNAGSRTMQENRNRRATSVLSGYRAFAIPCQGSLGNPNCGSKTGSPLLRTEFRTAILDSRLTAKRQVLILAKYAPGDQDHDCGRHCGGGGCYSHPPICRWSQFRRSETSLTSCGSRHVIIFRGEQSGS